MNRDDEFLKLVTEHQDRLYFYILTLIGDRNHVDEVLQETNYQIWKKSHEFVPGTNFKAWVFRIAHFQVMCFRQRHMRDHLVFCMETIEKLSYETSDFDGSFEDRKKFLGECLDALSESNRQAVLGHYGEHRTLEEIGKAIGKTPNAVAQLLFRIRKTLLKCILRKEGCPNVS